MKRLEAVEDQRGALGADEGGKTAAFVVRALALDRRRAEELERLSEKEIGRACSLLARPLAVERPAERPFGVRPALFRHTDRPSSDERRLTLAPERNERHDPGTLCLARDSPGPRVLDKLRFRLAADEPGRGVPVDAGDVDGRRGGRLESRQRRLLRQRRSNRHRRSCSRREDDPLSKGRLENGGLYGKLAIQSFEARVAEFELPDAIFRKALQANRNALVILVAEQHGNEALIGLFPV